MQKVITISFLALVGCHALLAFEEPLLGGLIDRVDRHVRYLQRFAKVINKNEPFKVRDFIFDDICFHHSLVQWAARTIEEELSLSALFDIWCLFLHHRNSSTTDNEQFLLDYSRLLLLVDYQLLVQLQKINWTDIGLLYLQISSLPLTEILDLLDEVREQLNLIMEKFPLDDQAGIAGWLQNYWWVPPVVGSSVLLTYIKWYLMHYQATTGTNQPPAPRSA